MVDLPSVASRFFHHLHCHACVRLVSKSRGPEPVQRVRAVRRRSDPAAPHMREIFGRSREFDLQSCCRLRSNHVTYAAVRTYGLINEANHFPLPLPPLMACLLLLVVLLALLMLTGLAGCAYLQQWRCGG